MSSELSGALDVTRVPYLLPVLEHSVHLLKLMLMNLVAVQMDIGWENKAANYATVTRLLSSAAPTPGSLVALPEMFATGFSMNAEAIAEPRDGATEQFLSATAVRFGVFLLAGAAVRGQDGQARNKALVFDPQGKLISYYAKMRPFTPGAESEHYAAGQRVAAFTWGALRVSTFICYDLRFPELFRQSAAAHGPQVFMVIANFPEARIHHWTRLLQARAIENQAYVAGVNRIGNDPVCNYSGHSMVVDPQGEIIVHAGETEGVISATIDLESLKTYREKMPFLRDLKI